MQARNNARVAVLGSLDMLSNSFFNTYPESQPFERRSGSPLLSGNKAFAESIVKWVFGLQGVIRVASFTHQLTSANVSLSTYTEGEEILIQFELQHWNLFEWEAFNAPDVQLEIFMLEPYIRINLTSNGNGVYTSRCKLPDVPGVFMIKLDYNKQGFTTISHHERIVVRPPRHDQHERFLFCGM